MSLNGVGRNTSRPTGERPHLSPSSSLPTRTCWSSEALVTPTPGQENVASTLEVTVLLPAEPPTLNPEAAAALLRLLLHTSRTRPADKSAETVLQDGLDRPGKPR